jgi:hypothetical protein
MLRFLVEFGKEGVVLEPLGDELGVQVLGKLLRKGGLPRADAAFDGDVVVLNFELRVKSKELRVRLSTFYFLLSTFKFSVFNFLFSVY